MRKIRLPTLDKITLKEHRSFILDSSFTSSCCYKYVDLKRGFPVHCNHFHIMLSQGFQYLLTSYDLLRGSSHKAPSHIHFSNHRKLCDGPFFHSLNFTLFILSLTLCSAHGSFKFALLKTS